MSPHTIPILTIALALGACATSTPITVGSDPQPARAAEPAPTLAPVEPAAPHTPAAEDRDRAHQPWEFTLAGSGTNDEHFNAGSAGVNGSIAYYFNEIVEVGVRQNVSYADAGVGAGDIWNFGSFAAVDFNIPLGEFVPFVGGNIGYIYGDSVKDSWAAGPEAGLKIYFKSDVFILLGAQWEFLFDSNNNLNNAFNDGTIYYNIGLGARF